MTVSAEGSESITNCSCKAGYAGPNGGPCTCCSPGQHKGTIGPASCKLCPPTSVGVLGGASQTVSCNADPNACCTSGETLQQKPLAAGNLAVLEERCAPPETTTPPFEQKPRELSGGMSLGRGGAWRRRWIAAVCALLWAWVF